MGDHRLFWWRHKDASKPPPLFRIRSARWFILTTVSLAVFTDIFLYGLIVPVLPFALSTRAGVPEEDVQHWVSVLLAVYGAALLAASPICGFLADKSPSRRLPLLVGLLCLAGATVMLCVGSSIPVLVTGRLLQGFSAAVVWTVGLALLVDTVGQQEVGQVMGSVFIAMSLAYLLAPLLGGIIYARAGYYAVYYLAFGIIALDILLRLLLIEKKIAKKWLAESPEPESSLAEQQSSPPSSSSTPPGPSSSAPTPPPTETTPLTTKPSALPPVLTLLASRRLLTALWGCLVQAALTTAFDSVLPLRVLSIFSWTSTGAGLLFLALVIPTFVAPLIGSLVDKHGPKYLTCIGFLATSPFLILLRLVTYDSLGQKVLLCALLAVIGFGLSVVMVPLMAEITYVVEAKERKRPGCFGEKGAYAQAYALFNVSFAGGMLVGPIWGGFVVQRSGWADMSLSLGCLCAFSAVPALIWTGGVVTRGKKGGGILRGVGRREEKAEGVSV
ncbi:hypothetical protein MMC30_003095 [Trapelia coarctata]|nr:hypothetical protein [Trapelia coarctata]